MYTVGMKCYPEEVPVCIASYPLCLQTPIPHRKFDPRREGETSLTAGAVFEKQVESNSGPLCSQSAALLFLLGHL